MDFKDIAKAQEKAEQLVRLREFMTNSWHANTPCCELSFQYKTHPYRDPLPASVSIPFGEVREAVKQNIDRLTAELTAMGVSVITVPK